MASENLPNYIHYIGTGHRGQEFIVSQQRQQNDNTNNILFCGRPIRVACSAFLLTAGRKLLNISFCILIHGKFRDTIKFLGKARIKVETTKPITFAAGKIICGASDPSGIVMGLGTSSGGASTGGAGAWLGTL